MDEFKGSFFEIFAPITLRICLKVVITPKMKIPPEMVIGVKRSHATYFLNQTCSFLVVQVLRFKNMMSQTELAVRLPVRKIMWKWNTEEY